MSEPGFLTFTELIDRFFQQPDGASSVEAELTRRYQRDAAILVVDFTEMVRRTDGEGIIYALALARAAERAMLPAIQEHGGQVVKRVADTFFAVFPAPAAALEAALQGVRAMREFNRDRTGQLGDGGRNEPIHPCLGLGWGSTLVIPGEDIYGDEVNRAFVLGEDTAGAQEVLASVAFIEGLGDLPDGVGAHRAGPHREGHAGFPFLVVTDYR